MPIYEYRCNDCSAEFEVLVSGTEPRTCGAKCVIRPGVKVYGGGTLERKMSAPAVVRTATVGAASAGATPEGAAKAGFTTYEKTDKGDYRKVAGSGPTRIQRPPSEN